MNKVSIVIPIYNSETNLDKCLKSIAKQSYEYIEILCINDGSKDDSEKIIKNFCKKDKRFKLINKENTGVSDTRNYGIKKATGTYIMFIDADDYIEKNYIYKMVSCIKKNQADMVISAYTEIKTNHQKQASIYNKQKGKCWDITYPSEINKYFSSFEYNPCWKQLIKKELLIKNNIIFNTNIKYGEDMLFSFQCYMKSKKTMYYKIFGYYYYINDKSVMSKKDLNSLKKHYEDNLKITEIITKIHSITEEEKQKLYYKTLKVYNKISWKMIYGVSKYKIWKKNIKDTRILYKDIFKNCKIFYQKKSKDSIFILLLKYKMFKLYYILQIIVRKITKKY